MWSRWTEAQGDVDEAVRILELLIGEGKEHWKAKVELAYIELRRGEELNSKLHFMDATEDAYAHSLSAGSEVVIKYSRFLSVQGEAVEVELLLEQAVEKNPKCVKLRGEIALRYSYILLCRPTGSGKTCVPEIFSVLDQEETGKSRIVLYFLGLSSLIEDKGRSAKVPTVWMNIQGKASMQKEDNNNEDFLSETEESDENQTDKLEDAVANFTIGDVKSGKVNLIILHAETIETPFCQQLLEFLEERCISYIFVDEWQKNLHWKTFRPKMYTLVPRLMLQLKAPVVLATATILPSEVKTAKDVWGVKDSVVIEACPVQCPGAALPGHHASPSFSLQVLG